MAVDIGFRQVGNYYSWSVVRGFGWKWSSSDPLIKTWKQFIQLQWDLNVTRDLDITVVQSNSSFKFPQESLSVSDNLGKQIGKDLQEFFSIADEHEISDFIKGRESIDFDEEGVRSASKRLFEIASVADELSVTVTARLADAISVSDSYSRVLEYIRKFNTNLSLSSSIVNEASIFKADALDISDGLSFDLARKISEAFSIDGEFDKTWQIQLKFTSAFVLAERNAKSLTHIIKSAIAIVEADERQVLKKFADSLDIATVAATSIIFSRNFKETLSVSDATRKTVSLSLEDRFQILDEILRGGGAAIISDLRMLTKALTDSEFEELISQTSPVGYGPFVPFIAGDYEYQEALYKVVMRSRDLSRPYVNQIRYEVDLPDLFDKGEITLPASRTNIPFNKKFNPDESPTLTIVVKAGSSGFVPEVDFDIRPDHQSFDVELRDPTNPSNLVSGTISWKAQGY